MSDQRSRRRRSSQNHRGSSTAWWKKILAGVAGVLAAFFIAIMGVIVFWIATAPTVTEADLIGSRGSTLVDRNGEEIYTLGGTEQDLIEYDDVPPVLEAAVLAIEDQRFYQHRGVDPIRIGGAIVANLKDGFGAQGGSTITQQLVKLSVFSTTEADQNIKRKVQEAWIAMQLERDFSKEQILTMYINKVYMSDNIYGMGTASEYYYGKPASDLDIHEAALLAGLPQLPNEYNPYLNPDSAKSRRDTVIYSMVDAGFISEDQAEQAYDVPIEAGLEERSFSSTPNMVIDSYVKQVLEEVQEKTDIDPYNAGATIHTNMDQQAQQHVYDVLNSDQFVQYPSDEFQAATTVVDVKTGQVLAMGGGRKVEDAMGYNRATELDRSIGSTMKPLSVYGPIIDFEQYSTYHQVVDEPYEFPTGDRLENVDLNYMGQISMRESLVRSRNITTAKFFEKVGLDRAEEFLNRIGIENMNDGNGLYWSNAIGGEITPSQLAGSYAAFGNGGQYTDPYTVRSISMPTGEEIDLTPETTQAMEDYTAYMVTDMLKDAAATYPNLQQITASGVPHAGKTGTTNYADEVKQQHNIPNGVFPDRWYAGYTSDYSISVWTGYDKQLEEGNWMSFNDPSGYLALSIYDAIMAELIQSEEAMNADWEQPESVKTYQIVDGSNPPREASSGGVTELFVKGNEPGNYKTDDLAKENHISESSESEESQETETIIITEPESSIIEEDPTDDSIEEDPDYEQPPFETPNPQQPPTEQPVPPSRQPSTDLPSRPQPGQPSEPSIGGE